MSENRSPRPAGLEDGPLAERLDLAQELGRTAARNIMPLFRSPAMGLEKKGDGSPVTRADRETEALLRQEIVRRFPEDGLVGEELGIQEGRQPHGFRGILDPIDGTESFVRGVPLFGTLIGIEFAGVSVAGVLALPALGDLLYAARDRGAWWVRGSDPPVRAR
ncbi:MAG: hypothetical protein KC729_12575, partial [Candidatus Eisenbacteria bacterium]|nr:hypothetical protein [Candidatus Eisenbacteria bacterium]